jgi:streptogramin lyase
MLPKWESHRIFVHTLTAKQLISNTNQPLDPINDSIQIDIEGRVSHFRTFLLASSLTTVLILAGCGAGAISKTVTGEGVRLQGQVHGGQQGIGGATLQLYTAGSGGNGSAAIPMLISAQTTGPDGTFDISSQYTCGQDSSGNAIAGGSGQVYLVATGGNPTPAGGANAALAMVAALGPCSGLSSSTFIFVNELTTVAAAWALAPFSTGVDHIGASATNTLGMTNAFLDAGLLANTTTGTTATLASNLRVETGKINALADALASCVNSDGTTACGPLFAAANDGSTATDTFTAALNIVKHPGTNVQKVFGTIGTYVPFATTLTQAPNDWTMSLKVTGGGLSSPTALGIDSQNNVWVASQDGPLSAFNAQGTPLSTSGFGAANGSEIAQVYGLAIDPSDNIWVTNYNATYNFPGAVTEILGVNSGSLGSVVLSGGNPGFAVDSCYPTAVAADTNGSIFVANEECSSTNIYNSAGAVTTADLGESLGLDAKPLFLAVDSSHGVWLSGNDNTIAHISAPSAQYPGGQLLSHPDCCANSHGLVTDATGDVWVANYLGNSFSEVGPDGTVLINQASGGGITYPYSVGIDAAQNIWFTNIDNQSISEIAGSGGGVTPGTPLSPSTGGKGGIGGYGFDAGFIAPFGVTPDRAGNLWVSDEGNDAIVMFLGLATPTITPLQPVPTAP